jgi:hypothetical protein
MKLNWSFDSKETLEFCRIFGFNPSVKFVKTAPYYDGSILVGFSAGKPDEVQAIKNACDNYTYFYYNGVPPTKYEIAQDRAMYDFEMEQRKYEASA